MTLFKPVALLALSAGLALTPQPAAAAEPLQLKPCRLRGLPTEVQCGTLNRPLDPSQPQGKQIGLRVVVIPALARNKLPDPVTFLAGGPGQSIVELADTVASRMRRLSNRRDIVLMDQRGTGQSAPLQCADDSRMSAAEALDSAALQRRLQACRAELEKLPHGDLRHYTTTIAMQDLDALRQALGLQQWNLIGASYGTRAALEYQRQFPQAVRRNVIDGVAPPDMVLPASFSTDTQAALDALLAHCAASPGCEQAFPKLATQWQQLLDGLPRSVQLMNGRTGKRETVTLQRHHVVRAVRGPLYAPMLASALPAAIQAAAQGDFDGLAGLASGMGGGRKELRLAMGMHFSVVCAEDFPRMGQSTDAPGKHFERTDAELYAGVCANWPRGAVPAEFYSVPKAQTATLVLSGGADPVTPPRHGERIAKALGSLAKHEVVPAAGHGVLALPCMGEVLYRFINAKTDAEALKVDASCAAKMPLPLSFVPPNPDLPEPAKKASAAQ